MNLFPLDLALISLYYDVMRPNRVEAFLNKLLIHPPPKDQSSLTNPHTEIGGLGQDVFLRQETPYVDFFIRDLFAKNNPGVTKELTTFGKIFQSLVMRRNFFDLGCGEPARRGSLTGEGTIETVVRNLGAKRYIGVDKHHVETEVQKDEKGPHFSKFWPSEQGQRQRFRSYRVQDDILTFLTKLQVKSPVFFLSAVQVAQLPGIWRKFSPNYTAFMSDYVKRCMSEISRLSKPGDGLVFGRMSSSEDFAPEKSGFQKIAETGDPEDYMGLSSIYVKL